MREQEQLPKKTNIPGLNTGKIVYNVSEMVLDETTKSVLAKGFNYAVTLTDPSGKHHMRSGSI